MREPVEQRVPIHASGRDEGFDERLSKLLARAPTDRLERIAPLAFALRHELPMFLAVTFGATLGLGLLGHVSAARMIAPSLPALALPYVLDAVALAALARLLFAIDRRVEFCTEGGALVRRDRWRGRTLRLERVLADEVLAVHLLGAPSRGVLLVGARNAPVLLAHREGAMDPPTLAPWLAQSLAVLVRAALAQSVFSAAAASGGVDPSATPPPSR